MATSRIFQIGSSFLSLRRRSNAPSFSRPPPSLCSSNHSLILLRRFHFPCFRRLQISALSSASAAAIGDTEAAAVVHPWPEWDQFVEKIRSKGYFEAASSESLDDDGEGFPEATLPSLGGRGTTMDTNKLKNACLKFSRDRFDIIRLLPKDDIKAVVECGCPNLFRKTVNSAKRLRAFLRLDEANVCGGCNIRGSCDRAYLVLHEEEGARTLDVVRVLLNYAINPRALLGGENPPVKVQVQNSARKILSELIKLSDTSIDPALPKPILKAPTQLKTTFTKNKNYQDVEMKTGDWLCPKCDFLNFSRNVRCRECKADGPKRVEANTLEMKFGDWTCPKCDFMNFARNSKCFRCLEHRPKRDMQPGDWECPDCDFLNFSRNEVCRRCSRDRPYEEGSKSDDHEWRTPGKATRRMEFKYGKSEDETDDSEEEVSRKGDRWSPRKATPRKEFKYAKSEDETDDSEEEMSRKEDRWSPRKATQRKEFKYAKSEDETDDSEEEMSRKEDRWSPRKATPRKELKYAKSEDETDDSEEEMGRKVDRWSPRKATPRKELKYTKNEDETDDSEEEMSRKGDRWSPRKATPRKEFKYAKSEDETDDSEEEVSRKVDRWSPRKATGHKELKYGNNGDEMSRKADRRPALSSGRREPFSAGRRGPLSAGRRNAFKKRSKF